MLDSLTEIGHNELKKKGMFILPGFAKFVADQEACETCTRRHQPVYQGADDVRGKARQQGRQGATLKAIKDAIA